LALALALALAVALAVAVAVASASASEPANNPRLWVPNAFVGLERRRLIRRLSWREI
jgi:hypothetical protein